MPSSSPPRSCSPLLSRDLDPTTPRSNGSGVEAPCSGLREHSYSAASLPTTLQVGGQAGGRGAAAGVRARSGEEGLCATLAGPAARAAEPDLRFPTARRYSPRAEVFSGQAFSSVSHRPPRSARLTKDVTPVTVRSSRQGGGGLGQPAACQGTLRVKETQRAPMRLKGGRPPPSRAI
jgi:hypothetical protein